MTVSSTIRSAGPFPGNSVATSFPFDFKVFAKEDLQVTRTVVSSGVEELLELDSDYSVLLNADQENDPGGSVEYLPLDGLPMSSAYELVVLSVVPATQEMDIANAGNFLPDVLEKALDRTILIIQQALEKIGRAITIPAGEPNANLRLPGAAQRANKAVVFGPTGDVEVGQREDAGSMQDAVEEAQQAALDAIQAKTDAETAKNAADEDAAAAAQDAGAANTSKLGAEAARDTAFTNADVYADTTAGLAAVALNGQFQVVAGDESVRYREDAGPVATQVARFPTKSLIDRLFGLPKNDFPGTRNLYSQVFTPRVKDLAASNFASPFPADHEFTITAGTANDYTGAIDGLIVGQPFIIFVAATAGILGVTTFTHNGVKALTPSRGWMMWAGNAEATTATIVVKNGSAVANMTGLVRYATGPVGATAAAPQESTLAVESFFDSGMPVSDQELLRSTPTFMAANASSALTTVTTAMAGVVLGDTIVVLAHVEMLNGDPATIDDVSFRVTATSEVIYSLFPLAEHPGWWYREIYLDPTAYTGPTITLVRTNAKNLSTSSFYDETARYVTFFAWRDRLPRFYPSASPDDRRGIQNRGNMRSRAYATTAAAEFNGYLPAMFGGVRRLWLRSSAGGDYLVVRKDPDTGDFIGSAIAVTHPGGGAGNEWVDFTNSIPASWKRHQEKGFVVGYAPNAGGAPGLVEYGSTVVGDTAFANSSWKSGTANGDDLTLFAGVGERIPGIYVEVEDRPGAVKRMGPMPLTRTGPADYQLVWITVSQSVYEGYALTPSNFHDYSKFTPAASLMWSKSQQALVPLHDPVGQNFVGGGSLWPAFAREFEERMKSRAAIIVNSAVGNTKVAVDWYDNATGAKAKWTDAVADLDAAMDAAHAAGLPISGVEVHMDLGTSDAISGTSKADFKADITAVIAQIRALVSPNVPIFYRPPGRGNTATPGETAKFGVIREAIHELANEISDFYIASGSAAINEARGLMLSDHYHDTLAAHEETGKALAAVSAAFASRAMPKNYTLDVARP